MNRWLAKHLELERSRFDKQERANEEREWRRQNETVRSLSEAYAKGEPPTLDDLLSNAERDWSLRSSKTPSETPRALARDREYRDTEYQDESTRESITRASIPPSSRRK
jgi:hypothetical protein